MTLLSDMRQKPRSTLIFLTTSAAITLLAFSTQAATIHVPADAATIQGGVDLAAFGDTVEVACGTYTAGAVLKDGIVVRSATGLPECVTIATPPGFSPPPAFKCYLLSSGVVIEGFRLIPQSFWGRGIDVERSKALIRNCRIENFNAPGEDCTAGGGMIVGPLSTVEVTNCDIANNHADGESHCGWGGGIYCFSSTLTVRECFFEGNDVPHGAGGGIYGAANSILEIVDSDFFANGPTDFGGSAIATEEGYYGRELAPASLLIRDCTFRENISGYQGIILARNATIEGSLFEANSSGSTATSIAIVGAATIQDCVFRGTPSGGPVIRIGTGAVSGAASLIQDCLFENNHTGIAGALWIEKRAVTMERCTVVNNIGTNNGMIYLTSGATLDLRNSIIAFSQMAQAIKCAGGTVTVNCSDIFGNANGDWTDCIAGQESANGNLSVDPLFCDIQSGDYTLQASSPCAPPQSGACGQIGAFGVGCNAVSVNPPVDLRSWGAIKALYR
jgi:hypothetical protein